MYGDGLQTRSFCYVDDLVDGLVRLMNTPADVTGPMNLGKPSEISILDLAQLILDLTNSRSRIVYRALPEDDPRQRMPDISLARATLDWEPATPLKDGLSRTIQYFDQLIRDDGVHRPASRRD